MVEPDGKPGSAPRPASPASDSVSDDIGGRITHDFIRQPFSANGVSPLVVDHYKLTERQVAGINNVAMDFRSKIAEWISEQFIRTEDENNQTVVYEFKGDRKAAIAVREELRAQLREIAGQEFADASVVALFTDARFFGGGYCDLKFTLISPDRIKFEAFGKDGRLGSTGEYSADLFRSCFGLDLQP